VSKKIHIPFLRSSKSGVHNIRRLKGNTKLHPDMTALEAMTDVSKDKADSLNRQEHFFFSEFK
jgi:hypothetical protein